MNEEGLIIRNSGITKYKQILRRREK